MQVKGNLHALTSSKALPSGQELRSSPSRPPCVKSNVNGGFLPYGHRENPQISVFVTVRVSLNFICESLPVCQNEKTLHVLFALQASRGH